MILTTLTWKMVLLSLLQDAKEEEAIFLPFSMIYGEKIKRIGKEPEKNNGALDNFVLTIDNLIKFDTINPIFK